MNNARRKRIQQAIEMLNNMPLQEVKEIISEVAEEEREVADNLAESFPGTEKADAAEEAAGQLETAVDALDGLDIDDIVGELEGALG